MSNPSGLNSGQEAAAQYFLQFLFGPDKEMGISGPGGYGKTHLMAHMIDEIMPAYYDTCKLMNIEPEYDTVDMTAMTNKAAEILSESTMRPTSTIHSLMNLTVKDDYNTGKSSITPTRLWTVHTRKIIFIDECSMIDEELYRYIHKGTMNCKIVYVGDHCQLRGIFSKNPIYENPNIKWFELTQPMRTQVPEILTLHKQLRETVETGIFRPIKIVPGIIDLLDNNQMESLIDQEFATQQINSRILNYTNKQVMMYNDYIRGLRGLPMAYTVGEKLVNNNAIILNGNMLRVEEQVEIVAIGDEYEVKIDGNVPMLVRDADLMTKIGNIFTRVRLPTDRDHYANLLKYFAKEKNWHTYYDLKNNYPDLRQRDSSTIYKAQGSTHETVIVDLNDVSRCPNPDQAARMLYVALSRMKVKCYLYGDLAPRYGGLIH